MRLSTRSRYGVRLMIALGVSSKDGPVFLKEIARAEEISEKYLSQIIIPLKAKGLVNTFRGAHGGYVLGRTPSEIRLRDIIEPLEGDLGLVDCVGNSGVCGRSAGCVTREVWEEMSALLLRYLESVTLEELIIRHRRNREAFGDAADFSI